MLRLHRRRSARRAHPFSPHPTLSSQLSALLDALPATRGVVGVAVIAGPGAVPDTAWSAEHGSREPAFLAYSITKTVTATIALRLVERGQLSLDDKVARWFPAVPNAERMTLRQVLNHGAGIPDYGGNTAYHDDVRTSPGVPWSFERFAAETYERGLLLEPGAGWAYSNVGYMLLRRIVEQAGGDTLHGLVHTHVTAPLGLTRTFVADDIASLSTLAPALSRRLSPDGSLRDVRTFYHPGWVSHGVMASTPSEIARFIDALFAGHLVSPESLGQMTTLVAVPRPPGESAKEITRFPRPSYGLGMMGDPETMFGLVHGHNGGGPGYGASVFRIAETGMTACAMVASEDGVGAEDLVFAALLTSGAAMDAAHEALFRRMTDGTLDDAGAA